MGGRQREVEAGVEADRNRLGGDPARPQDELGRQLELDGRLLGQLADRGRAVGQLVGVDVGLGARDAGDELVRLDAAAGEDPDARHEAGAFVSLDQQHLELSVGMLAAAAQQEDRGGRARGRGLESLLEGIAGPGGVFGELGVGHRTASFRIARSA